MKMLSWTLISSLIVTTSVLAQNGTPVPVVEKTMRDATIDTLIGKIVAGYVLPENVERIVQPLRLANRAGQYDGKTPQDFVEAVNTTLLNASRDKHLKIFYQPGTPAPQAGTVSLEQKERFNYGFGKLERLPGNIALLEITSFTDLTQQSAETASALLSTLVNFDAVIVDMRRNGGGNTPMMAFVATYFFEPTPVHLTDIYWRDTDQTSQFWTNAFVPGKRSSRQPLFILTSVQTFSGAEDFCYSLQNLKRAIVVGEITGGGAHSGRGLQRLSDSFTAFVPVGRSVSPITKSNWEETGVVPDVKTSAAEALGVAHELALKALIERETNGQWKQGLQQLLNELAPSRR
jgi:C-terminal processing protease CtpA/Prc